MRSITTKRFDLKDTLECGQTFSWRKHEQGYVNSDIGQVVYVEQDGDRLLYESSDSSVSLKDMFRLEDPLDTIHQQIAKDELIQKSIAFAPGLRVISDDFFPCLISFICSTFNNIPRIQGMVKSLRERYGPTYEFRGQKWYGMPNAEQLALATATELRDLGFGWRGDFIVKTTQAVLAGNVNPDNLSEMPYLNAHRELKRLHGVGDKVADCVCLFSLGFLEAFPIDVWIERVIQQEYGIFTDTGKSYAKKSAAAREYFGPYAGYTQQYLFHYVRCISRQKCAEESIERA